MYREHVRIMQGFPRGMGAERLHGSYAGFWIYNKKF